MEVTRVGCEVSWGSHELKLNNARSRNGKIKRLDEHGVDR